MIGETIKWRMKIVNQAAGILLGVGLISVLKNNDFLVKSFNEYDKHGCYAVYSGGYSYTYLDK